MKKYIFISIILALTHLHSIAQTAVELLTRYAVNVYQFENIYPQEKVFLQFDNTSYFTGETLFFKAYVVNASNLRLTPSKVLYVELLSPDGVILKQEKLKITEGQADGSIELMDNSTRQARELRGVMNYPSGYYEVRAYTANMLNFNYNTLFSRILAVYERPETDGDYYTNSPSIQIRKSSVDQKRPQTAILQNLNVEFYPEGGHLIVGKPCNVAFKATTDNGMGVFVSGKLTDTDILFETVHDGMGSFVYTPDGKRQSAEFIFNNKTFKFDLPNSEYSGCIINVEDERDVNFKVEILSTPDFRADTLGLTLTCRGELIYFDTLTLYNLKALKTIPIYKAPEGVCRLNLFNRDGAIICSRSIYNNSKSTIPQLTVKPNKSHYGPFEKIELEFSLKEGMGIPFKDRFCLSVRDSRLSIPEHYDDLRTAMLLSSDLKGLIYKPEYYFESDNENRATALDLLMLVQGWDRYEWNKMAGVSEFKEVHRMEDSIMFNGWILSPLTKKPMEGVKVLAAVVPPDKTKTERFTCITDKNGYFGLNISDFEGEAYVTINTGTKRKKLTATNARIKLERSLTPPARALETSETLFCNFQKTGIDNTMVANIIKPKIYNEGDEENYLLPEVEVKGERIFIDYYTFKAYDVNSDVEVEMDGGEYTTDVLGYLIDKGYAVSLRGEINGRHVLWLIRNKNGLYSSRNRQSPLSIDTKNIESLMVFDNPMGLGAVMAISPSYSDLFNNADKNYGFGNPEMISFSNDLGYDQLFDDSNYPISSFHSIRIDYPGENSAGWIQNFMVVDIMMKDNKDQSSRKELLNIGKRITTLKGYSDSHEFYNPTYPEGPVMGDVDYRRTLYWNPNVITDQMGRAKVEFYNNSFSTEFNAVGAGITKSGTPYIMNVNF